MKKKSFGRMPWSAQEYGTGLVPSDAEGDFHDHASQMTSEDMSDSGVPQTPGVPHPPLPQRQILRAYENEAWLKSRDARLIRILSEFMETQGRLRQNQVFGSIVFFGSARLKSPDQWIQEHRDWAEKLEQAKSEDDRRVASSQLEQLARQKYLCFTYYDKITKLAKLITEWAQTAEAFEACSRLVANMPQFPSDYFSGFPRRYRATPSSVSNQCPSAVDCSSGHNSVWTPSGLVICTGGGPGMMEAANKGAAEVPGGRSMGMGVTLPFESNLNPFIDPALAFQYHYFFTRKFWMIYIAMGVVVAPGGVGTLDELMEILTLRQTGRFKKSIPIVLFGKEFWKTVLNFDYLYDNGLISEKDREMMLWTDDEQEAFEHVRSCMTQGDAYPGPKQFRR
eukprot:Gregarina_sp_Poly_1__3550@NODE_2038_length_2796_cov_321_424698_g1315_i0_p1_GENE_NODE_2038_length_2796_cov_321_424698_g1315_i0NODE_2038_length_2796_cov_321_424698_g1315_i0_p1_ORF_typecomplete_len394_score43_60Lysine_decarbox/PF03641_14/4_1e26LDcluster4/PF18306_1/2_8e03LDcluster4/PF18306_1/8_4e14_NODE_2038_length_2796_cov_321_424698_g1315_i010002181